MKRIKIFQSKNTLLITYKLLHDALLLGLLTFSAMLLAEGLLPGIVSSHISMARVAIALIFIISGIVAIGSKLEIVYDAPKLKKNLLLPFLILAAFLLIGNSMLHLALWQNITITLTVLLIFFLIYDLIFVEGN